MYGQQRETENDLKMTNKKFESYTHKELVERINHRFANNLNDDDEVYELFRRRDLGLIKVIPKFKTYEIEVLK
jgi:hypothetical protein